MNQYLETVCLFIHRIQNWVVFTGTVILIGICEELLIYLHQKNVKYSGEIVGGVLLY